MRVGQLQNPVRRKGIAGERGEAIKDRHRGLTVQLLVENGLGQTVKRGLAKFHTAGSYPLNNLREHGIRVLEMVDRLSMAGRLGGAGGGWQVNLLHDGQKVYHKRRM